MSIVAGIDEAGYGPVLGPLVVSATAFEVPEGQADGCLWRMLSAAVARKPSRHRVRIAIGDSKRLYARARRRPLEHLERAVLAMLATAGRRPASFTRLIRVVAPDLLPDLAQYPWYADADLLLPHSTSRTDVELAANSLTAAMGAAGVRLRAMRCEVLPVGRFNRIVGATRNKSVTLLDTTLRLVAYLWRRWDRPHVRVFIDRHGSRRGYLRGIQRAFGSCHLKVVEESQGRSAYCVASAERSAEIDFLVGGEDKRLPVGLASMLSKYVRELMMVMFNRFWGARVPGLAPTAGYHTDGRRFFGQIEPTAREMGLPVDLLYRRR